MMYNEFMLLNDLKSVFLPKLKLGFILLFWIHIETLHWLCCSNL